MASIALTYGVYSVPRFRIGGTLRDEYRDDDVIVAATTDGRVAWPCYRPTPRGGKIMPVLTAGLVDAVRRETVQTICAMWGVSRDTVHRWRRALGVPRMNDGTQALWRHLAKTKLTPAVQLKGGAAFARAAKLKRRSK